MLFYDDVEAREKRAHVKVLINYNVLPVAEIGKNCRIRVTVHIVVKNRETEEKRISGGPLP